MPVITSHGGLTLRTMRDDDDDYRLMVRWRAEPHVRAWWDPDEPAPDLDAVRAHYGPRARPEDPTTACIIELDGVPIGYLQFYRWLDWPEDATALEVVADAHTFGIDVFIGEPRAVDRGVGTRAVSLICEHLERTKGALAIALATETTNLRAQRAYEKAGFRKVRQVLDADTRDGQRIRCWLMVRSAAAEPAPPS
jgi:aminoglycoside 6'-N-acetyltransferase